MKNLKETVKETVTRISEECSDESVALGRIDEFDAVDIIKPGKLLLKDDMVYYSPSESELHKTIALKFGSIIAASIRSRRENWSAMPVVVPVCSTFWGGWCHNRLADNAIVNGKGDYPVVIEAAFTHESYEDLVGQLINYLSEYTLVNAAIGIKMYADRDDCVMDVVALERATPKDPQKRAKLLEALQNGQVKIPEASKPCPEVAIDLEKGNRKAFEEAFGVKVSVAESIGVDDIDRDFAFKLDSWVFGEGGGPWGHA